MLLKMTEEPEDFEGKWPTEENGMTIDKLREHLRLGGMVAAIADVRALMAAHDALAERAADADRDYADMRRFQARYIEADQELRALRADAATDRKLVQAAEKFIQPVLQELQFERGHGSLAVHNLRLVLIEAMKANAKHAEIDAARAAKGGET